MTKHWSVSTLGWKGLFDLQVIARCQGKPSKAGTQDGNPEVKPEAEITASCLAFWLPSPWLSFSCILGHVAWGWYHSGLGHPILTGNQKMTPQTYLLASDRGNYSTVGSSSQVCQVYNKTNQDLYIRNFSDMFDLPLYKVNNFNWFWRETYQFLVLKITFIYLYICVHRHFPAIVMCVQVENNF